MRDTQHEIQQVCTTIACSHAEARVNKMFFIFKKCNIWTRRVTVEFDEASTSTWAQLSKHDAQD
jgi:hypothetical protein